MAEPRSGARPGGVTEMTLAVVVAVALGGFFAGTRQIDRSPSWARVSPAEVVSEVPAGKPYREVAAAARVQMGPLSSDIGTLREAGLRVALARTDTEADREASLAARAERRAFAGAPPAVPHPVDEQRVDNCLECHGDGLWVEGRLAPPISHAHLTQCTQCHASIDARWPDQPPVPDNAFVPLRDPPRGVRAAPGSPPIIPHRLQMRQTCVACHGAMARPGLRTSHPERRNCRQCHAAQGDDLPWQPGVPPVSAGATLQEPAIQK